MTPSKYPLDKIALASVTLQWYTEWAKQIRPLEENPGDKHMLHMQTMKAPASIYLVHDLQVDSTWFARGREFERNKHMFV